MSFIRTFLAFLLAAVAAGPAWAARTALPPVPGEVIVQFKADATVLRKHALAARGDAAAVRGMLDGRAATLAARVGRTLEAGPAVGERMQVVRARGLGAAALAAQLAADPEVEFAVPNGRQRIVNVPLPPNDPLYLSGPPVDLGALTGGPASGQWYLRAPTAAAVGAPGDIVSAIDIESAWARTLGRPAVVVAVLDTGVRFEHPDLRRTSSGGSLLPGYDFVSDATIANDGNGRDGDPSDPGDWVSLAEAGRGSFTGCEEAPSSWHGTGTASLIGAATNNQLGMAGSAPGVRVLPVRVLGKCYGTDADIQAGILWAAGLPVDGVPANPNPARVINMSLGGTGACSAAYQSVVDRIVARGVVIVPTLETYFVDSPDQVALPDELYAPFLDLIWMPKIRPGLLGIFSVGAGWYSDFEGPDDGFRLTARAIARSALELERVDGRTHESRRPLRIRGIAEHGFDEIHVRPRQLKKYFWLSDTVVNGLTVACLPSTLTANVSGFTSIFGVPELRTMLRLPILRMPFTGITCRSSPSFFLMPAACAAPDTKVMQESGSVLPKAPNIGR